MRVFAVFSVLICCFLSSPASAQVKAFPEAEGFGATTTGGRGGDVYHVTSLLDNGSVGTLRHGIDSATGPRTIVFDVGGWIELTSKLGIVKNKHDLTIAGQTAPGGGIGVRGNQFSVGGDNIIVRHMRFRPGKDAGRVDSVNINADAQHVIFDHISAGFSYDENFSIQASDVTLQYSTVNYGLQSHSAGSLIEQAFRLSIHHTLYSHNHTRNPKARVNENLDWINNVAYDYNNGFIAGDSDTNDYFWTANVDGNYYITGPADTGRPMIKDGRAQNYGLYFGTNAYDNDGDAVHDGVEYTGNGINGTGLEGVVSGSYTWASTRYDTPDIWQEDTPQAAYERVLSEFGATPWQRDQVDQLLRDNVVNRTGDIISHENQLVALGVGDGGFGVLAGGSPLTDTDGDGMPDAWENDHGLSPTNPNDRNNVDPSGYTMLEVYLNALGHRHDTTTTWSAASGIWSDSGKWDLGVGYIYDNVRIHGTGAASGRVAVGSSSGPASAFRLSIGGNGTVDGEQVTVANQSLTVMDSLTIGDENHGTLRINSGMVRAESVLLGNASTASGSLELAGGTLETMRIVRLPGTGGNAQWIWSGGAKLRPRRDTYVEITNDADRLTMTIDADVILGTGGGVLDTEGHNAEFSGVVSGIGSLTKRGKGILRFYDANSFTGPLVVQAGGVALGPLGSVSSVARIDLEAGTTFDATDVPGGLVLASGQTITGKGTVRGNLTASAGSVVRPFGELGETVHTLGLQAENLSLGSDWALFDNALHGTGNGGSYNGADLDGGGIVLVSGESLAVPTANGFISTTFDIPVAGQWYLFAKVTEPSVSGVTGDSSTQSGGNNSFWTSGTAGTLQATTANFEEVQTGNDSADVSTWVMISPTLTALDGVDGTVSNPGINYNLASGPQTFAIGGREVGTVLDGFVLANSNLTAAQLNAAVAGSASFNLGDAFSVEGNFVQHAGATLAIEIGSADSYNKLTVNGAAMLDGVLDVSLVDLGNGVYQPRAGDSFEILSSSGGYQGTFSGGISWPALTGLLEWDINYETATNRILLEVATPFTADFDGDGDVDHDDLTKWQSDYGNNAGSDADGNGHSDGSDFLTWQRQYTGDLSSLSLTSAVPEPEAWIVLLQATAVMLFRRRGSASPR